MNGWLVLEGDEGVVTLHSTMEEEGEEEEEEESKKPVNPASPKRLILGKDGSG